MNYILESCGALPLSIVCAAGVLACYVLDETHDKLNKTSELISTRMKTVRPLEKTRHIIILNYNHLPPEIKNCMIYLSIFPRGYVIDKDRLLYRWIAEGLVEESQGMSMQEVAECYFDELLFRNMIEPVTIGYDGRVELCKVHDMVLEVLVSKALETYFVALLSGQHRSMSFNRSRRLSIHGDGDSCTRPVDLPQVTWTSIQDLNMQRVRSLSIFHRHSHKLLDELDKFTLLLVLDLEGCSGVTDKHVKQACQLHLLKFLSLRGTRIYRVPAKIKKLEHLQTFDVRDTLLVEQLPKTVCNLQKLERLMISKKNEGSYTWRLPRGLKKMKALQKVSWAFLTDVQVASEIGELQQLQELDICIDKDCVTQKVLSEFADSLSKLYSLRRLNIQGVGGNAGNSTLNFSSLPHLPQHFRVSRSLMFLVEFVISEANLTGNKLFDTLCGLPKLRSIWIQQGGYSDEELVARNNQKFPVLINLKVTSDAQNPKVIVFEEGSMKELETLEVSFAEEEKSIAGIEHLTNLKEVKLTGKRDNSALKDARRDLEAASCWSSTQFQVVVRYN